MNRRQHKETSRMNSVDSEDRGKALKEWGAMEMHGQVLESVRILPKNRVCHTNRK